MTKYIDKSALAAEIERRIKEIDEIGTYLSPKGVLTNLLCHLDTLEVKEVQEEPVSEDLKKASIIHSEIVRNTSVIDEDFIAGAKWKEHHLWKPADGDDLPEIDREVIALEGVVDPTATDCLCGYKVVFAHRPTQEGYDGKSIATGVVEHYTPKTYDKGGWNIPDVKYWLDCQIPNIED